MAKSQQTFNKSEKEKKRLKKREDKRKKMEARKSDLKENGSKGIEFAYVDHNGIEFKSVTAIACSLEHINLAYATLGWFIRFPIINNVLQAIIDTMEFGANKDKC